MLRIWSMICKDNNLWQCVLSFSVTEEFKKHFVLHNNLLWSECFLHIYSLLSVQVTLEIYILVCSWFRISTFWAFVGSVMTQHKLSIFKKKKSTFSSCQFFVIKGPKRWSWVGSSFHNQDACCFNDIKGSRKKPLALRHCVSVNQGLF